MSTAKYEDIGCFRLSAPTGFMWGLANHGVPRGMKTTGAGGRRTSQGKGSTATLLSLLHYETWSGSWPLSMDTSRSDCPVVLLPPIFSEIS
jgi:hypothetical protein